jgi:menaquinone-specific isochorismate synthase
MSLPATELTEGTPSVVDPRAGFLRTLRALRGTEGIAVIHVEAPRADPSILLSLSGYTSAVLWASPGEPEVAALGELVRIEASGEARFAKVRDEARALFASVRPFGRGPRPRLYGGFAFAPGSASSAPWSRFGDASFCLPRWTYSRGPRDATLSFAFWPRDLDARGESVALDELDRLNERLSHPASEAPTPTVRSVVHQDQATFEAQVREIVDAIRAGHFEKVVAARRSEVALDGEIDPATVAQRLSRRFGGCTTFAFRRDGATFLGATPERLLTLSGRTVRTEALAGTASAAGAEAEETLCRSDKDLEEHLVVVREVEKRLGPIAESVTRPAHPAVRRLPNVLHLSTPITAELVHDLHVLDVAAILHPTPAVGGVPRDGAVDWIVARENAPRGWYSGPVGWVDAHGDGALSVALRSGLLVGDRAYVWAGGGIVRDSQPGAEYEEAAVKLGALLDALTGQVHT